MNCESFKTHLASFVERDLSDDLHDEMASHLDSCPACAGLFRDFSLSWEALETWERIQPSPLFWRRLEQRINAYEAGEAPASGGPAALLKLLRPLAAAALLTLCVFLGHQLGSFPKTEERTASLADERTLVSQQLFGAGDLNPLDSLHTGSVEAAWLELMSEEQEVKTQ